MVPLTIVDFRVFVYNILHHFESISSHRDLKTQKRWLKAVWAIYLNRGITTLPYFPHTCVVVDDGSPYWRLDYLKERGFPDYKAGRKPKPDDWYRVAEAGFDYILNPKSPFHYLKVDKFEADDMAGSIVRLAPKRTIFLHTIDTDWLGLVHEPKFPRDIRKLTRQPQDEMTVFWNNLVQWTPRLRGKPEAIEYVDRRLKRTIKEPREIWDVKVLDGDKSDNLIPGSPLEVIDLLNPPKEWDILRDKTQRHRIEEIANAPKPNTRLDHLYKSCEWLRKEGFGNPMYDFDLFRMDFSKGA